MILQIAWLCWYWFRDTLHLTMLSWDMLVSWSNDGKSKRCWKTFIRLQYCARWSCTVSMLRVRRHSLIASSICFVNTTTMQPQSTRCARKEWCICERISVNQNIAHKHNRHVSIPKMCNILQTEERCLCTVYQECFNTSLQGRCSLRRWTYSQQIVHLLSSVQNLVAVFDISLFSFTILAPLNPINANVISSALDSRKSQIVRNVAH